MQLDYYPNPRAYPHHLEKKHKTSLRSKKTSKPAFGRWKCTPSFNSPPEGEMARWAYHWYSMPLHPIVCSDGPIIV